MYLNGVSVDADTFSGSRIKGSSPIEIGHYNNGADQFLDGQVAEVQVWSTTRTAQQIADGYDQAIENPQSVSSLAAYWQLGQADANGVIQDLSAGNHDATLGFAVPSSAPWLNGPVLALDGTNNDYVQASGGPGGSPAITLEAWINPHSIDNENAIIAKGASYAATNLFNVTYGGYLAFYASNSSQWVYSTTPVAAGEWSHVAVSFDPTAGGVVKFYVDGVLAGTTTTNGGVSSDTAIGIGTQSGYGDRANPFDGEISDVRVWSDVRTGSEIADNMDARLEGNESGLVGYWPLDGNLTDLTSTPATATITGATFESAAPTVLGPNVSRAMDFSGTGEHVSASGPALANSSFSWEFWSFRDVATPNSNWILSQGSTPDTNQALSIGYYGTAVNGDLSNYFVFGFFNNDVVYLNPTDDTGQWVHWAGTYDSVTNERKLYKNGVLVAYDDVDDHPAQYQGDLQATGPLVIGSWGNGNDGFDGRIADVRVWNDVRSADEIRDNMSHFVPWDSEGLAANWRLDDAPTGAASTAADSSPGGHNGTIIGSPDYVTNSAPIFDTNIQTLEDVTVRGMIETEDGGTLAYTVYSPASHGTVNVDTHGNYSYEPAVNFHGTDTFSIRVTPTAGSIQTITFNVNVTDDTSPALHLVSGTQYVIPTTGVDDIIVGSSGADAIIINGPMESGDTVDLGAGTDSLTLNYGANGNTLVVSNVESLLGSTGADHVTIAGTEIGTTATSFDGGNGSDELIITATAALTRAASQLTGIQSFETWTLGSDQSYSLTLNDYNVASGQTLTIDGFTVTANLTLDATAETDGKVILLGGSGSDTLTGGAGNDILRGGAGDDRLGGRGGADILDGGDGFDRVSYSGASAATTINLATGTGTVNGVTDTLISIESVIGSAFADTITGSDNSALFDYVDGFTHPTRSRLERFAGLAGNDIINGGAGFDQVDYSQDAGAGGTAGVTVNLSTGTATDGFGNTDTLTNIEFVRGTMSADTLTGANNASGTAESFIGLGGNDVINGGTITSGATNRVDYSNDASFGGTNRVVVNIDTASHSFSGGGTINAGTAKDGFGDSDTLTNINDVTATNNNDELFGGTTAFQTFAGLGGADIISGFGTGITQVDYSRDAGAGGLSGVTVNLSTTSHNGVASGTAVDGFGDTDTLSGIRGVRGTNTDDFIYGGTNDERFRTLGGDDYIDGGAGTDEIDYSNDTNYGATHGAIINLTTGTATDGFGDTDTLLNIENVTGTSLADTITGDSNANTLAGGNGDRHANRRRWRGYVRVGGGWWA